MNTRTATTTGARLAAAGSGPAPIHAATGGPGWSVPARVPDLLVGLAIAGGLLVYWSRRAL